MEKRWRRFGHDRVYVSTADEIQVGYVDLKTGSVELSEPDHDVAMVACRARWEATISAAIEKARASEPASEVDEPLPPPGDAEPSMPEATARAVAASVPTPPAQAPIDLSQNLAGSAAQAKRNEVNSKAPVRNLMARALGVRTGEAGWREGAVGERKVAVQLDKLGEGWHRMHAVPIGNRGSDIDHVVVGPAGVFTLNSKRHDGGTATVYGKSINVNGKRVQYLRNARFEAERASALLSEACGTPVAVWPIIVFVDLSEFTVKHHPAGVYVTTHRMLTDWLRAVPATLDAKTVEVIWAHARWDTTWQA